MIERWVIALIILGAAVVVGVAVGWFVRRRLRRSGGGEATTAISSAAGFFVFWVVVLVGALAALAMVRPETLENLPRQVLDYTPRILVAGVILLAGYAVALGSARVVAFALQKASRRFVSRMTRLVRWVIVLSAVILALAQLGVDTTILVILVAVVGSSVGLASALLVGWGGRAVAAEISAGRYVTRFVDEGSVVSVSGVEGTVVAVHPATIEIAVGEGRSRHVPFTQFLEGGFEVTTSPE